MAFQQFPQKGGIPSGNTAARPSSPVIGDTYYNGEVGFLEIYDGTAWIASSAPPAIPSISATDVGTARAYGSSAFTYSFTAGTGPAPYGYATLASLGAVNYTSGATTATTGTLVVGESGTYSISATANNGFGTSPASIPISLALTSVPQAPTIGTASTNSGTTNITITWTLGSTGGKNLSAITVTPYLNGTTAQTSQNAATTSSTSITFTGLTQGSAYTFKVSATNANGTGLESAASNSVSIPILVDYLIVAGGGGGGRSSGGGGGAGGYLTTIGGTGLYLVPGTNYLVTVDAAGASQQSGSLPTVGGNSIFSSVTATGGGGGGGYNFNASPANTYNGVAGGSGGGAWGANNPAGAASPSGQGNAGGTAASGSGYGESTGGGGGAGAVGANGGSSNGICGAGGVGLSNSITGSAVFYAGGGGGGYGNYNYGGSQTGGAGGNGGGGQGANNSGAGGGLAGINGGNGTANTGGGGGGSSYTGQLVSPGAGGNGGSGVVILRYPDTRTITFGAGVTGTESSASGGYKRATITAGSGNVSWA
jgi:hypothetical protein